MPQNGKTDDISLDKTQGKALDGAASTEGKQSQKSHKHIFQAAYYTVFVIQGCFFVYSSLIPYIYKELGVDTVTFSSVQSAIAFLQLFTSPLIGRLGDRYGARTVLLLSVLSSACGTAVASIAGGLSMLVASRLLSVGQDVRLGAQILVSDLVPGKERGPAMGRIMLPFSLGLLAGPIIGGQASKYLGNQGTLLVMSVSALTCVFVIVSCIPANTKIISPHSQQKKADGEKTSAWALIKAGRIPLLLTIKLLTCLPFLTFAQNLVLFNMKIFKLSPAQGGLLLSFNGLLGAFFSGFALGRLSKRFGEDTLLKWAPALSVLAYAIMSQISGNVWLLLVAFLPWNLANSIIDNQVVAKLTRSVPSNDTGTIVGVNAMMFQVARIIAPILGGFLLEKVGFYAFGYFGFSVSVLTLTLTYFTI